VNRRFLLLLLLAGCTSNPTPEPQPDVPGATPAQPAPGPRHTERLILGEKIYLGYQLSPTDFQTCAGSVLVVGSGTVEPTNEGCPSNTPPPVMFMTKGTVTQVNADQNTVVVRTPEGKEVQTFIPKGSGIDTKTLQVNKEVMLHAFKAPGNAAYLRAEKIEPVH
jgi:hypothetical protein